MAQMVVGYRLIEISTGDVVQSWGGTWAQCPAIPNPIALKNGDIIYAPSVDVDYSGFKLEQWWMDEPPPPVPQQVPMWAVRTVLQDNGLFNQAQALIDVSPDNALKNIWEYGNFAERTSPAINSLGEALSLTPQQMDEMFQQANTIIV